MAQTRHKRVADAQRPQTLRAVWMYYLKAIFFRNKGLVVRVEVLFNLSHARPAKVQQEVVAKFFVVPFVPLTCVSQYAAGITSIDSSGAVTMPPTTGCAMRCDDSPAPLVHKTAAASQG
jgi:hypothetical protein